MYKFSCVTELFEGKEILSKIMPRVPADIIIVMISYSSIRMWFWVQPVSQSESTFHLSRDSIYIAIILLGLGGATLMVLSLSMVSMLVGEYSVSCPPNYT